MHSASPRRSVAPRWIRSSQENQLHIRSWPFCLSSHALRGWRSADGAPGS